MGFPLEGSVASREIFVLDFALHGLCLGEMFPSHVPEQRYSNMWYGLWPLVSSTTTGLGLQLCSSSFTEDTFTGKNNKLT